jgi:ATP-dependent helicase/nuclease subunit A
VPSGVEPSARRPSADREILGGTAARAARRRGTLLHRILQELSEGRPGAMARARLQNEWPDLPEFDELWAEATRVAARPELRRFLNPAGLEAAYNELPILYESAGGPVYGVMDRVVLSPGEVTILDYKTDRDATPDNLAERAAEHHAQLRLYAAGVARLWPQRRVRAYLVYTVCGRLIEVPLT